MNILLMSTGGGGGNILRSLKTLFARDVAIAQKTDAAYAERLRRAVTTRFLDTNEFSLAQVPVEEQLLIGRATTHGLGSRHDPTLAARALEESREQIVKLVDDYSIVVIIGTGGKGTGAGTTFPLADMVRRQNKLVLPVFVRPSFERHEVDKRRYDHALHVGLQFDEARIRLIEILNDHAYSDSDPQPQSVVWERMNMPIARGLRGLIYVLWDLSEVDPSDLAMLLAGNGRMRIGFGEIDPPEGHDPTETQIREAVDACWQNPYVRSATCPAHPSCASRATGRIWRTRRSRPTLPRALSEMSRMRGTTRCTPARFTRRNHGESRHCSRNTQAHTSLCHWCGTRSRRSWTYRRQRRTTCHPRLRRSKRRLTSNERLVHCSRPLGIWLGRSTGSTPSLWNSLPTIPSLTSSSKVPRSGSSSARSGSDRSFRSSPLHGMNACSMRSPLAS